MDKAARHTQTACQRFISSAMSFHPWEYRPDVLRPSSRITSIILVSRVLCFVPHSPALRQTMIPKEIQRLTLPTVRLSPRRSPKSTIEIHTSLQIPHYQFSRPSIM